jgi:L-fuconolactonase
MYKIDSHQHFWNFDPVRDSWITDDMAVIQKDFTPTDLLPVLQQHGFDGCVAVQTNQHESDNDFLLNHANNNEFIKGVVGWVDLCADNVKERLEYYSTQKKMKGFRHVLQGEAQRDFMLRDDFKKGIALLQAHNFTYDILIYADQLKYIPDFVKSFPNQPFVIDHIAKPEIKAKNFDTWAAEIKAVSQFENVSCKLSGMVTEADWAQWQPQDILPYIEHTVNCFGTNRVMYGSDWPVCLVAASYTKMYEVTANYFANFSKTAQDLFFGGNATTFYKLN